ncbi:hypothetical protein ACWCXX_24970 [Streptomyces sp. NPDC001732]
MTAIPLITRYATDIAFVAEDRPAATLAELAEQTSTAAERLEGVGIQGAEDLDDAAACLLAAETATGSDRAALLHRAGRYLTDTADMVGEYRLMV